MTSKTFILFVVCCFVFVSCAQKRYFKNSTVGSATTTNTKQQTQYIRDSIYIDRWHTIQATGDTIYRTDSVCKIITKLVHDTVRTEHSDTVREPVLVEVEKLVQVEKPLTKIQQSAIKSGYILWLLVAVVVGAKLIKIAAKFYGL